MNAKDKDYVVIVAGGKGTRMGTATPKQFLPVGGCPVLMRTIERFVEYDSAIGIVVVLPRSKTIGADCVAATVSPSPTLLSTAGLRASNRRVTAFPPFQMACRA